MKLIEWLFAVLFVVLSTVSSSLAAPKAVEEPWSEIEARTKFLRTKHYIEVVRVHSDVYPSAQAKGGKNVPGPFPCTRGTAGRLRAKCS